MMLPKSMMHLSLVILCLLIQTGMIFGLSFQKQKLSLSRKTIASSPLPTPSAAVTATTVQKEIKENKLDYKGTSLTVLLTALLMGSISPEPAHADVTTWIQPIFPNPDTYWKYFFSGAISASLSHGVTVPFDVVKTKIQTSSSASDSGKKVGLLSYAKTLVEQEGVGVLLTGMAPTLIGYWIQGSLKYGLYELFKPLVKLELLSNGIALDGIWIFMIASAFAESIASSTLSPFEASRIRMVSSPSYADSIQACVSRMVAEDGPKSLFAGLPAILLKNVPYTVVQLSTFELFTTFVYSKLASLGYTSTEALHYQIIITIVCALVAAFLATLASQPGDSLLSAVNKAKKSADGSTDGKGEVPERNLLKLAKSLGFSGLYRGLSARMLHVAFIVVIQLTAYDYIKQLCGIPATGFH